VAAYGVALHNHVLTSDEFEWLRSIIYIYFPVIAVQYLLGGSLIMVVVYRRFSVALSFLLPTLYMCFTHAVALRFKLWYWPTEQRSGAATGVRLFNALPVEIALQLTFSNAIIVQAIMLVEYFTYWLAYRAQQKLLSRQQQK